MSKILNIACGLLGLCYAGTVIAAPAKPVKVYSSADLQKMADIVYSEIREPTAFDDRKVDLLNNQPAAIPGQDDAAKRIQEAVSAGDDSLKQIYRSAVAAQTLPATVAPEAAPVRQPEPAVDDRRSSRLDAWVQRQTQAASQPLLPDAPAPSVEPVQAVEPTPAPAADTAADLFRRINDAASAEVALPSVPQGLGTSAD